MSEAEFRVGVLASGAGTNLQALLDSVHGDEVEAAGGPRTVRVVAVGSDKPGAIALERAERAGIERAVFPAAEYADGAERDHAIGEWLADRAVDLVVLAGYMTLLSPAFIERFRGRIINVHPALLPSFPGLDAIGQALEHGVKMTGVTVHFVDEGIDTGPILFQRVVPVPADRDPELLEETIHTTEHALLPEAVRLIAAGRTRVEPSNPRVVHIDSAPG